MTFEVPDQPPIPEDTLTVWARHQHMSPRREDASRSHSTAEALRFAFYGRVSTAEFQHSDASKQWQLHSAIEVIGRHGRIVAEFFDVGCSRRLPWHRRPRAAELLECLADPGRGFEAVVVGECERAFSGTQLMQMAQTFLDHDVQIWLPELAGSVDFTNPVHQASILQLGSQAHREVLRSRFRTTAAMRAQALHQGRYLGGRPPYGGQARWRGVARSSA